MFLYMDNTVGNRVIGWRRRRMGKGTTILALANTYPGLDWDIISLGL